MTAIMGFGLGWFAGSLVMWGYFKWARLIRTRHEWYSDSKIRRLDPEEADTWLHRPDSDPNWG